MRSKVDVSAKPDLSGGFQGGFKTGFSGETFNFEEKQIGLACGVAPV